MTLWPEGSARTLGATAATAGSTKWCSIESGQPGGAIQSESRNAINSPWEAEIPVLRAAAGPRFTGCTTKVAPWRAAAATTEAGSRDPSSTTVTDPAPKTEVRVRSRLSARSIAGMTTLAAPNDSSGVLATIASPRSTSIRQIASVCRSEASTPVRPLANRFLTTVRARPDTRLTRQGEPPISAEAFAHPRTPGASRTTVPRGSERSRSKDDTTGAATSVTQDRVQRRSGA